MSSCFDLSGFIGLNDSQKLKYKQAWGIFDKVQDYNSNVSTIHQTTNNSNVRYYTFYSYEDRIMFRIGQSLHVQRYPNSNWSTVEENWKTRKLKNKKTEKQENWKLKNIVTSRWVVIIQKIVQPK